MNRMERTTKIGYSRLDLGKYFYLQQQINMCDNQQTHTNAANFSPNFVLSCKTQSINNLLLFKKVWKNVSKLKSAENVNSRLEVCKHFCNSVENKLFIIYIYMYVYIAVWSLKRRVLNTRCRALRVYLVDVGVLRLPR